MNVFLNDKHLDLGLARHTACHEVGHALGLNHSADWPDVSSSCLGGYTSNHPHPDDRALLTKIYSTVRE